VEKIVIHRGYNPLINQHDIAMVKFNKPFVNRMKVCMPVPTIRKGALFTAATKNNINTGMVRSSQELETRVIS
jgi:hypothetical protein